MIKTFYKAPFPTLAVDEQYFLREQLDRDTQAFFQYYTHPDVKRYILANIPKTIFQASDEIQHCKQLFYQQRGIYWTLASKSDNTMIGAIGLYINNANYRAEICYDLDKNYWGKGIMQKAMQAVLAFSFETIGVRRIEAITLEENTLSIKLLKRLGFTREGTLRKYRYHNQKQHDIEFYSMLPSELLQS